MENLNSLKNEMRLVKDTIKRKTKDFEEADRAASELQRLLVSTSARLENLKASVDQSSSLGAYLQLNEVITEDDAEDVLLKPGTTISVVLFRMSIELQRQNSECISRWTHLLYALINRTGTGVNATDAMVMNSER